MSICCKIQMDCYTPAQAALLSMVAKEKEKEASKQRKKKDKKSFKPNDKEDGDAALAKLPGEAGWVQQRRCQQCTALQQCSRCSKRSPTRSRTEAPLHIRPIPSSPLRTPHATSHLLVRTDGSGEWEVQQGKRRGAPQVSSQRSIRDTEFPAT